jgi:hypothetical protein
LVGSVLAYITLYRQNLFPKVNQTLDAWLSSPIIYAQAPKEKGVALNNAKSLLGATLIIIGVIVITKDNNFPGWWAVLPTIGAALIISAGMQAWFNRTVLSNRVLVWFGLISFPLYLWHWPLLSFARIVGIEKQPTQGIRIAAIVISIILAWLTYKLIEKPIRLGKSGNAKTIILFVLMLIVGFVGYHTYKHDGFRFRLKDRQEFADYFDNSLPNWRYFEREGIFEKYRMECDFYDVQKLLIGQSTQIPRTEINNKCFERNRSYSNSVFIWGDSHAQHLYFGLKNYLPSTWQILQVATSACSPFIYLESSTTNYCLQSNWFALKTISEIKPDVVIVAQAIGHNIDTFNQIIEKLKSLGVKKIILVGSTPHWTSNLPKIIITKLWGNTPRRTYKGVDQKVLSDNALLQEQFKQTDSEIFANVIDVFCNKEGCLTYLGDDKKTGITTIDYGHLTPLASEYLAKNLLVNLIVGNNTKAP